MDSTDTSHFHWSTMQTLNLKGSPLLKWEMKMEGKTKPKWNVKTNFDIFSFLHVCSYITQSRGVHRSRPTIDVALAVLLSPSFFSDYGFFFFLFIFTELVCVVDETFWLYRQKIFLSFSFPKNREQSKRSSRHYFASQIKFLININRVTFEKYKAFGSNE